MKKIYLDLKQQKRTLEQNDFTIPADSEEAKAFFTTKQPNEELVIDLENKTTYFEEYQMQEDGTRYSKYLNKVDGVYIPDIVGINEELRTQAINKASTDLTNAVLSHLDEQCKSLGFTGDDKTRPYRAVASYVGFDNVFRVEAEKLGTWIALTFKTTEQIQSDVESGNRDIPTVEEILSELPIY